MDETKLEFNKDTRGAPVVYKQVAIRDGRYWSCFVGVLGEKYSKEFCHPALEYKIGQITYAEKGSVGIFCNKHKETALQDAKGRLDMLSAAGLSALLECHPIGQGTTEGGKGVQFPAVFVVRELWREAESIPNPKYKVGDKVTIIEGGHGWPNILGKTFVVSGVYWGQVKFAHKHYHYYYDGCDGVPCDEKWLELVPPEPVYKWVNVTEECTAALHKLSPTKTILLNAGMEFEDCKALVEVHHAGNFLFLLGMNQRETLATEIPEDYKVEVAATTARGAQWFRVLHKVEVK